MTDRPSRTGKFKSLELRGLSRSFGGFTALDGLDLSVEGGEFVALLGPSGCGKSTALNLLAGLLEPTGGSIWLDDQRVDTLPSEKRDFGMVFQNYALFPHMSVADNVGFGLKLRKVAKAERIRRVEAALNLVQLGSQSAKFPGQLSGGQQQRVAIARAVVTEPRLVLMDEPLSNLDAKLRIDMRTEIRLLHQELGLTTIYVTHDQAEALSLADRLVVMKDGLVQQVASPEVVYEDPANAYVAAFVGYRNSLPAKILSDGRADIGGAQLVSDSIKGGMTGDATVMIRPDDITIDESVDGVGASGENLIPLKVRVCEYQGRVFSIEGRTEQDVAVHCQSDRPLAAGSSVVARIRPERVKVYSAQASDAEDRKLVTSGSST